jgi:hypothetical protein
MDFTGLHPSYWRGYFCLFARQLQAYLSLALVLALPSSSFAGVFSDLCQRLLAHPPAQYATDHNQAAADVPVTTLTLDMLPALGLKAVAAPAIHSGHVYPGNTWVQVDDDSHVSSNLAQLVGSLWRLPGIMLIGESWNPSASNFIATTGTLNDSSSSSYKAIKICWTMTDQNSLEKHLGELLGFLWRGRSFSDYMGYRARQLNMAHVVLARKKALDNAASIQNKVPLDTSLPSFNRKLYVQEREMQALESLVLDGQAGRNNSLYLAFQMYLDARTAGLSDRAKWYARSAAEHVTTRVLENTYGTCWPNEIGIKDSIDRQTWHYYEVLAHELEHVLQRKSWWGILTDRRARNVSQETAYFQSELEAVRAEFDFLRLIPVAFENDTMVFATSSDQKSGVLSQWTRARKGDFAAFLAHSSYPDRAAVRRVYCLTSDEQSP